MSHTTRIVTSVSGVDNLGRIKPPYTSTIGKGVTLPATLYEELILACDRYTRARSDFGRMRALYMLKEFLDTHEPLEVFLSLEVGLHDLGQRLNERHREAIRQLGFQFPEDLDNALDLLSNPEDSDGLL